MKDNLKNSYQMRIFEQLADQLLAKLRNDKYISLVVISMLKVLSDLNVKIHTLEEVLY
jgi:hypothetical protein